eukprot:3554847-Prymnesium_polylepis.1
MVYYDALPRVPPMTPRSTLSTPRPSVDVLPSERSQARKLQSALTSAFERAPLGSAPPIERLSDEAAMLDMCLQQLIKQLAPRCVEWGGTLEVIRSRLETLWAHAGELAGRALAADVAGVAGATAAKVVADAELRERVRQLEIEAALANARVADAERRAAEAEAMPAHVQALEAEVATCRAALDERRVRDASERTIQATLHELV